MPSAFTTWQPGILSFNFFVDPESHHIIGHLNAAKSIDE